MDVSRYVEIREIADECTERKEPFFKFDSKIFVVNRNYRRFVTEPALSLSGGDFLRERCFG